LAFGDFRAFDYRIINAYTEAFNGLAKVINRLGRGDSFDLLRAKLLLNYSAQKALKARFQRRFLAEAETLEMRIAEEPAENLGIDISTLTQKLFELQK